MDEDKKKELDLCIKHLIEIFEYIKYMDLIILKTGLFKSESMIQKYNLPKNIIVMDIQYKNLDTTYLLRIPCNEGDQIDQKIDKQTVYNIIFDSMKLDPCFISVTIGNEHIKPFNGIFYTINKSGSQNKIWIESKNVVPLLGILI